MRPGLPSDPEVGKTYKYLFPLCDTGNRYRCLINSKTFQKIAPNINIIPCNKTLTTAGQEPLPILGQAESPITISFYSPDPNEKRVYHYSLQPWIVQDLSLPCILSYHDLKQMKAAVNADTDTLQIHTESPNPLIIPTIDLPQSQMEVSTLQKFKILPNHERIIEGCLPPGCPQEVLIEGSETFMENSKLMIPCSLAKPRGPNNKVFVRVWNPHAHPITINRNTVVATADPFNDHPNEDVLACLAANFAIANINQKINLKATGAEELNAQKPPKTQEELYKRIYQDLDFDNPDVELTPERKNEIVHIFMEARKALAFGPEDLGLVEGVEFPIETGDHPPIRDPCRPLPPNLMKALAEQIKRWLGQGVAEPCSGPWAAALVPVRKKNGGWRFAIDYRRLNAITKKDSRPVANIQDRLARLKGPPNKPMKFYASLDLSDAYHAIPIRKEDQEKTCVTTPLGNYSFKRVNFGLSNAPSAFHRVVQMVEQKLMEDNPDIAQAILLYFDDAVICGHSMDDLLLKLRVFLKVLGSIGLRVQPKKCSIGVKNLKWLGHQISPDGIMPDYDLVRTMKEWDAPKNVAELASLYGTLSYFRKFIRNFSAKTHSMTEIKKQAGPWRKGQKPKEIHWNESCQKELDNLLTELTTPPILAHPDFSEDAEPMIVSVDTSRKGIGAILTQKQKETDDSGKDVLRERVIAYASKKLKEGENHYSSFKLELMGMVYALHVWRYFLLAKKFIIRTDHKALTWCRTADSRTSKAPAIIFRWQQQLADYDFSIEYVPASRMKGADGLSRKSYREGDDGIIPQYNPRSENIWGDDEFDLEEAQTSVDDEFWSKVMKKTFHKTSLVNILTRSKAKNQVDEDAKFFDPPTLSNEPQPLTPKFLSEEETWAGLAEGLPPITDKDVEIDYHQPTSWWLLEMVMHNQRHDKNLSYICKHFKKQTEWPQSMEEIKNVVQEIHGPLIDNPQNADEKSIMKEQKDLINLLTDQKNGVAKYYTKRFNRSKQSILMTKRKVFGQDRELILIPSNMHLLMLQTIHHGDGSFHMGIDKTLISCLSFFYFPFIKSIIQKYISKCRQCTDGKRLTNRYGPGLGRTSSIPKPRLKTFAMDCVMYPKGKHGFNYLLTILDVSTLWMEAYPMRHANSKNIGKILEQEIFPRFGEGLTFITDRGKEFVNKKISELTQMFRSRIYHGTPYHSNSNPVERHHRTLNSLIRAKLIDTNRPKEDWPEVVPAALYTMRCSPSNESYTSAFYRVYGFPPTTQGASWMGLTPPEIEVNNEELDIREQPMTDDPYPHVEEDEEPIIEEDEESIFVKTGEDFRELAKIPSPKEDLPYYAEVTAVTEDNKNHEKAQALKDLTSERRHQANKKKFDKAQSKRFNPIPRELIDWKAPVDPESTHSRKLANYWDGPFSIIKTLPHKFTAEIEKIDLATMTPISRTKRTVYLGDTRPTLMLTFQERPKGNEWTPLWMN